MYFPHVHNPRQDPAWDTGGDGGWWNVFQFKADDANGVSQPLWVLNVGYDATAAAMRFYLYSPYNTPGSRVPDPPAWIPVGQWFHIEAYYRVSDSADGQITIWMNGQQILDVPQVITSLVQTSGDSDVTWGIGNYTEHIVGHPGQDGTAVMFFDDAAISTMRLGTVLADVAAPVLIGVQSQKQHE